MKNQIARQVAMSLGFAFSFSFTVMKRQLSIYMIRFMVVKPKTVMNSFPLGMIWFASELLD